MLRLCTLLVIAVATTMSASSVGAPRHRLPPTYHWGRCLLEVDGKRYISGACAYQIADDGGFEIQGPHQVYGGIDYAKPPVFAGERSNDYFAQVGPWPGQGWTASWNENIRATHAQSILGEVTRKGACWVNARAKICLWRK